MHEGDVLWTTAGRGIIHNERAEPQPGTRILQLWFALPSVHRWVEPHFDLIERAAAPVRREPGVVARVYGGASGDARVVLYAGQPQHTLIVTHGPFVGGSRAELMRMSREYLEGRYVRMGDLVRAATNRSG